MKTRKRMTIPTARKALLSLLIMACLVILPATASAGVLVKARVGPVTVRVGDRPQVRILSSCGAPRRTVVVDRCGTVVVEPHRHRHHRDRAWIPGHYKIDRHGCRSWVPGHWKRI
ncbi:MAG: hypothetical protein AB7V45_10475 [Candidatus Krumholzibacteriia bacterium]